MSNDNSDILRMALERKAEAVYDRKEAELKVFCDDLCERAINYRLDNPEAHDFTGNLLNSIVVILYRRGRMVQATFSSSMVPGEIGPKMTTGKFYHWKKDYSGVERSFNPDVQTDEGYGRYDAESFAMYYKPNPKAIFEIVCAYTVEYAKFVEMQRQTAGYLNTVEFIKISAPRLAA